MRNKAGNFIWGMVFILIGLAFALNAFGLWDISVVFFDGWWTLFIIIPCAISVIQHGFRTDNVIGLCIGAALLLMAQDFIELRTLTKLIVPAIFVLIGVSFFTRGNRRYYSGTEENGAAAQNCQNGNGSSDYKSYNGVREYSAILGGRNLSFKNEVFSGARLESVLGSIQLDIREATMSGDVYIDVNVVLGGVEILVPYDVKIEVYATPILGGISNKAPAFSGEPRAVIHINGSSVLGGIDIR